MKTIALILVVLAIVMLCFAGLGIKIIVKKNGEFKRHCSSMDPYTGKSSGCMCAAQQAHICKEKSSHPYQPLEVNNELMKTLKGEE